MNHLYHFSDDPNVIFFEPRPASNPDLGLEGEVVFAIGEQTLPNYLLQPVTPISMKTVDNILLELARHDVEIRILPSLWPLFDAVVNSSLQFSMIRMKNVRPRNNIGNC